MATNTPLVLEIRALQRNKEAEAHKLLRRLAGQVKKVMEARSWKVVLLSEFFPKSPNLLGLNVNRGQEIRIRLRPANDPERFYPYEHLLDTMLHELVHNVHGPHDVKFYKLLEVIRVECKKWMDKGFTGATGFDTVGKKLGGPRWCNPSEAEKHRVMELAALKRRQNTLYMNGVRLGGNTNLQSAGRTPSELAAWAAEKRMKDNLWCGGECNDATEEGNQSVNSSGANLNEVAEASVTNLPQSSLSPRRTVTQPRRHTHTAGPMSTRVPTRTHVPTSTITSATEIIEILDSDDDSYNHDLNLQTIDMITNTKVASSHDNKHTPTFTSSTATKTEPLTACDDIRPITLEAKHVSWACIHCTFSNSSVNSVRICSVCARTQH
eukprot:CFRG7296T1